MTPIERVVKGTRAFTKLVANPADPVNGPLFQMCVEYRLHRKLARIFRETESGVRLLEERPHLNTETFSIASLLALPADTFGHAFARYFGDHGIAPLEPGAIDGTTDEDYVCARLREAHDALHVVTGYDTDDLGEIELQCFNLGNLPFGPIPIIATVGAYASGAYAKHGGARAVAPRLRAAYERGRRARFLADVVWEDHFEQSLASVRARFAV